MKSLLPCLVLLGCGGLSHAEAPMVSTPGPTPVGARGVDMPVGGMAGEALPSSGLEEADSYRKLVRTGNVSVTVDAWEPFEAELQSWLDAHDGFIADVSLSRWEGQVGSANLTVRVPSDAMPVLVSWTQEQVEVTHLSMTSEDVTAQWIDVEARLKTLRQTEGRLLELVDEGTATLADVLAAERELGRIRGDIESFEQQQRALADRVNLASLTMHVSVRTPYSSLVERSFGAQAADAWSGSVSTLGQVIRGLALLAVASIPWLAVLFAGLGAMTGAVWVVVRRLRSS